MDNDQDVPVFGSIQKNPWIRLSSSLGFPNTAAAQPDTHPAAPSLPDPRHHLDPEVINESGNSSIVSQKPLSNQEDAPNGDHDLVNVGPGILIPAAQPRVSTIGYRGNLGSRLNQSAAIADNENCSLFIHGLPLDTTVQTLLSKIRNVGKIYQTSIQASSPSLRYHTAAAKMMLFERSAADKLVQVVVSGALDEGVYQPSVRFNKYKVAAQPPSAISRVLKVTGPAFAVDPEFLLELLRQQIFFDLDQLVTLEQSDTEATLEMHFGSVRCQSEWAKGVLSNHPSTRDCLVQYVQDPCVTARLLPTKGLVG